MQSISGEAEGYMLYGSLVQYSMVSWHGKVLVDLSANLFLYNVYF